jgi:hypothetical protein
MAKGEPNHVTIQGPGIDEPWVVRDPQFLDDLGMGRLEDIEGTAFPPAWIEEAYLVTRGYEEQGNFYPFDQVLYAPDPQGGKAFVYYVGIYDGEGPYDRHWYHATAGGQQTMETIVQQAEAAQVAADEPAAPPLEAISIPVASGNATSSAASSPTGDRTSSMPQAALLGLILVAAGFGAGWILRRRPASGQPN